MWTLREHRLAAACKAAEASAGSIGHGLLTVRWFARITKAAAKFPAVTSTTSSFIFRFLAEHVASFLFLKQQLLPACSIYMHSISSQAAIQTVFRQSWLPKFLFLLFSSGPKQGRASLLRGCKTHSRSECNKSLSSQACKWSALSSRKLVRRTPLR